MLVKSLILKDKEIFIEDNRLYLKLVYEYENERGVHELIIPKIELQIRTDCIPLINNFGPPLFDDYSVKWDSIEFKLSRDNVTIEKNGRTNICPKAAYVINTIKEKPREMTIAEIEKKLGYKIKLVSEENKNE